MKPVPIPKPVRWFLDRWRGRRWDVVLHQYTELGSLKAVLADIAQRGGIYSTAFIRSEREAAFAEGRRSLALEIIDLAGGNHEQLRHLIEYHERTPQK